MNTYFLAAIILAVIVVIILFTLVIRLHTKVSNFTRGSDGTSLESVIKKLLTNHELYEKQHNSLVNFAKEIDARVSTSHRGFAIIRFNAYEHTGGNQSFACATLDESGNGMVLSSLYSRERSNVFAKPIQNFTCEFELTKEEKQVIKDAKTSLEF